MGKWLLDVLGGVVTSLLTTLAVWSVSQYEFTPAQIESLERQEAGEILPLEPKHTLSLIHI